MKPSAGSSARAGRPQLELEFARDGGGGTWLSRQRVRFPYTIGAPFRMDPGQRRATLILQSASGGLYGGERVAALISAGPGADAEIVTPGATVVHSARGGNHAAQSVSLTAGPDSRLIFIPRMNTLLPGARLDLSFDLRAEAGARLLFCDGFCLHRPTGVDGEFDWLRMHLSLDGPDGVALLRERSLVDGAALAGGLNRRFWAFGTVILAAPGCPDLQHDALAGLADDCMAESQCNCGTTVLRHGGGILVRVAAADGGALDLALEKIVSWMKRVHFSL